MKGRKIITILIIMNLLLVGMVYNLISKVNVNNKKQVIKEMSETEYEENITKLNQSHRDYVNHVEESKKKIASAISDMGVITSSEATPETMASNIRSIERKSNVNFYGTKPQANVSDGFSFDIPSGIDTVYLTRFQLTYTTWYQAKYNFNGNQITARQGYTTSDYQKYLNNSWHYFASWIEIFDLPNNEGGTFTISFDTNPPYHYAYIGY